MSKENRKEAIQTLLSIINDNEKVNFSYKNKYYTLVRDNFLLHIYNDKNKLVFIDFSLIENDILFALVNKYKPYKDAYHFLVLEYEKLKETLIFGLNLVEVSKIYWSKKIW